jgi:hypothetical protein
VPQTFQGARYPVRSSLATGFAGAAGRQVAGDLQVDAELGVVPRAPASSQAVAGVTPRLPRTISCTRWSGTPMCSAK